MSAPRLSVFVSATTHDLQSYRGVVTGALVTGGVFPVVQDHFVTDHRSLLRYLREQIDGCDAVVCLVGFVGGAAPPGDGDRTFTQIEYDLAVELGKPVFVFLAAEGYAPDRPPCEGEAEAARQHRHRAALLRDHKCTLFATAAELRLAAAELIPWLPRPRGADAPPFRYLHPPREPARFVGREAELRQLAAAGVRSEPCLIAVVGLGGQGKTTLVARWVKALPRPPAGLWCTAYRGGFTFDAFLDAALGYLLGASFDKREFPDAAARVRRLLGLMQERPLLLVVDGVERWLRGWGEDGADPLPAGVPHPRRGRDEALDEFLVQASGITNGTHVVLTTRALPAALDDVACAVVPLRDGVRVTPLAGLDDDAAAELLLALGVCADRARLVEAARAYASHPLALTVLGVLVAGEYGGRLDGLPPARAFDPEGRLSELFDETRRHLPAPAVRFLAAASHFLENPPLEGLAVALAPTPPAELRKLAATLAGWQLAEWDATGSAVRLHALVKDYFAPLADDPPALHARLARWYAARPVPPAATTLRDAAPRLLAVEHAMLAGEPGLGVELVFAPLTPAGTFADWVGAFGHATAGADLLGRLADRVAGPDRADLLTTRAVWLRQLGRLDAACTELDRVVSLLTALPGVPDARRLAALAGAVGNRGNVHREAGRFAAAAADLDRAVAGWEVVATLHPRGRVDLARARVNRGNFFRDAGELTRAVADCTAGIEAYDALGPEAESDAAMARANRANALSGLWRDAEARHDYDRARDDLSRLVEGGRKDLVGGLLQAAVSRGAFLASRDGGHAEAVDELDRAAGALRRLVDDGRREFEPLLALANMNAAAACRRLGRADARPRADAAVASYEHLVAAGRPDQRVWLAQALWVRAEAAFPTDPSAAHADRDRSVALMRLLIRSGESDVVIILLRTAGATAPALAPADPDGAAALLRAALAECEAAEDTPAETEELRLVAGWAAAQLADHLAGPGRIEGIDTSVLFRLRTHTSGG